MSGSYIQSPLQEEDGRPPPPSYPSAATASSRAPLEKANSSARESALTKNLGFPFRFLLQELDTIPPRDQPKSSKVKEKESSIDSLKREVSIPASPLRSPPRAPENTIPYENSAKSLGRDDPIVATRLKSLLEDSGSPIGYVESSLEKPSAANQAEAESVESGRGKVMRMESGVVRRAALRRAEVGLRVSEAVLCLVSYSVMATDKTSGWAGDYFDRYQEYRYCFSVNIIAFAYSTFQVYSEFHHKIWKKHIIRRPISYSLDLLMDQVLAYLLISASSSAATRNDDWVSMFGSDKFTDMMIGSIALSFLSFLAFSINSIISAYKLFSSNP